MPLAPSCSRSGALALAWFGLCFLDGFAHGQIAAASPTPDSAPVTILTGARLIDGTGKPPLEDAVLTLRGDRIVSVMGHPGNSDSALGSPEFAPAGARLIDVHGQTIIPGLISAHSHLGLTKCSYSASADNYTRENVARQLAQYEGYGVTAVMSLGVNRDVLYDWRNEQRRGELPGADIFTADRGLGVPGGVPPFPVPGDQVYRPKDAEEARADVQEMASRHPDLIKLWLDDMFGTLPKMSPAVFAAAIETAHAATDEAHQRGLRVAAHLFYLADAEALVDAGVDVLAHSVRDRPVDARFISKLKAKNVAYIPTLSLDESQFIYAEHPDWMDGTFFTSAVDPGLLDTWLSPEYAAKLRANPNTAKNHAAFEMAMKNVRALHDAEIFIAMGTDSGAMPTRLAGFEEHRELQLLVRAGFSPMEAIVCATAHSAAVIGQADDRGTLEPGKRADFLVLEANPLDDIRNTTRLAAVWHGGKAVVPFMQRPTTPPAK